MHYLLTHENVQRHLGIVHASTYNLLFISNVGVRSVVEDCLATWLTAWTSNASTTLSCEKNNRIDEFWRLRLLQLTNSSFSCTQCSLSDHRYLHTSPGSCHSRQGAGTLYIHAPTEFLQFSCLRRTDREKKEIVTRRCATPRSVAPAPLQHGQDAGNTSPVFSRKFRRARFACAKTGRE